MHTHTHTHPLTNTDKTQGGKIQTKPPPWVTPPPLMSAPLSPPLFLLSFLSQLLHHLDRTLERFDSLLHLLALVSTNGSWEGG